MMQLRMRLPVTLWNQINADLLRPHPRVHERLGLLVCKSAAASDSTVVLLPSKYEPILDDEYEVSEQDPTALIGSAGIRRAMTLALVTKLTCLYVHLHRHLGRPQLSGPDAQHGHTMVLDLLKANSTTPQGFFVFSYNAATGLISSDGVNFFNVETPTFIYGRKAVIR